VTSPLASDRTRYQPGTLGAATLRSPRPPSKSLALGRVRRAVKRQWPWFVVVAIVVSAAGVGYDLGGGVRPLVSIAFWAPLGLAGGLAFGFFRELGRNTVTSLSSFGKHRGYAILGAAPELTPRALRQLAPDKRTPLGCLAFQQASPFASAFRDLQANISNDGVVAFAAALPGEGATTAALCTAISASQQGRSVVVIDCDVRKRALTHALGYDPDEGVLNACALPERWQDFVGEEEEIGLHFIPAGRFKNPWRSLSSAPGFPDLLNQLREHYDLIILDCPPALSSADAQAVVSFAQKIVLVTAWDRTPLSLVRRAMQILQQAKRTETGVYVNRVPPEYRFGRLRGE
jgi:Mrp family chromosome partitioning ATPase